MQFKQLFLSLNNNKQFSRQIQVLHYLSIVRSSVSIIELSEIIGCSSPTLRGDIKAFNEILPLNVQIESLGKDGYFLSCPEGVSIPSVIMDLARETDVYRIIDGIFNNKLYSFDRMVDELFISPYMLRNIISHINSAIQEFNVQITSSPLDIVGNETDIRFFFFAFYYDFNDFFAVDGDFSQHAEAYLTMIDESREYMKPHIHLSHFRATLWIMIIKTRIKHKRYITLSDSFRTRITDMKQYLAFEEAFREAFSRIFLIYNPPTDDIAWAFATIMHCISYSDPTCDFMESDNREYLLQLDVSEKLLTRVNNFLKLEFSDEMVDSPILDRMRAFLINLDSLTELSPQFQRYSISVKTFAKESITQYYLGWMKHLYSREGQDLFPLHYIEDIAVGLALMHFSLLSQLKQHDLNVLFAFQGEPGFDDFLIQQTKFMIPQNINSSYIFDQPITKEMVELFKPDIVVSNYGLPHDYELTSKVVRLSYIPNISEWTSLRNIILDLTSFA